MLSSLIHCCFVSPHSHHDPRHSTKGYDQLGNWYFREEWLPSCGDEHRWAKQLAFHCNDYIRQ